jgi:hypothetical protein
MEKWEAIELGETIPEFLATDFTGASDIQEEVLKM